MSGKALFVVRPGVWRRSSTGCICMLRHAHRPGLRIIPSPWPSATPQALITASDQEPALNARRACWPSWLQAPDG